MKAIQLEKPGEFRIVDIADPAQPGPGEALVRTHRIGICGTDISGYLGKMPFFTYPRIPGHELGVEVLAVGEGVTTVKPGDRCAVEPYMNCGQCFSCKSGHPNCCENLKVIGVMSDGGMREKFLIRAAKLHPSAKLSFDQLALVETLAIGCHAVDRGGSRSGEFCLIIGAGPIGLAALEFAKLTGATVIIMDLNAQRLQFCREVMGVAHTIQVKGDGSEIETLKQITGGLLAQVVIDATGSNKSMGAAVQYVGFTGKLVFVGITSSEFSIPHPIMHRREMSVLASRNAHPDDFGRIIRLIEDGRIDTRPWITHRSGFDRLIADFPAFTRPETGVIKAVVEV